MLSWDKTIDHGTLRRLADTGVPLAAKVVGAAGGWSVVITCGSVDQTLALTRGDPRTFRKFETLAAYLKDLGITDMRVRTEAFEPIAIDRPADRRRDLASERMRLAHEAAAHNKWFAEEVQASIDDPRPNVSADAARAHFAGKRETLRARIEGTDPKATP